MSEPTYAPPLHVGDIHDDDAAVFQSFTMENPNPPEAQPDKLYLPHQDYLPPCNRLITGSLLLTATSALDPFPLFPADNNRKSCYIAFKAIGTIAPTDYVYIGDDNGKLGLTGLGAFRLVMGTAGQDATPPLDEYTGPIFIAIGAITQSAVITWMNVTK